MVVSHRCLERARPTPVDAHQFEGRPPGRKAQPRASAPPIAPKRASGLLDAGPLRHLRDDMLRLPVDERFAYDPRQNLFFVNFERLPVRSKNDIRALKEAAEKKLVPIGRKVYAIVNYDNFSISPELLDEYSAMVRGLVDRY